MGLKKTIKCTFEANEDFQLIINFLLIYIKWTDFIILLQWIFNKFSGYMHCVREDFSTYFNTSVEIQGMFISGEA